MDPQTGSYGTGRDPQRKGSYLVPIIFLLLSSFLIHGLTLLYVRNQEQTPEEEGSRLLLDELPTQEYHYQEPVADQCGLGLQLSDISEIQQRYWSLPDGAFIEQIEPDSRAYLAGLRSGDLLVRVGDHRIFDAASCLEALEENCQANPLLLVYYRDGVEYRLEIPLHSGE